MQRPTLSILLYIFCALTIITALALRSRFYPAVAPHTDRQFASGLSPESELVVHYHERRPFYYRDPASNGVVGLCADPISLVFHAAGISFRWQLTPAGRQLESIKNNATPICAAGWYKTAQREQFGTFTLPIYRDLGTVALARADQRLLRLGYALEDVLANPRLTLLVKSGYSYGTTIDEAITRLGTRLLETASDNVGMLAMIQNHRADYFFLQEEEAVELLTDETVQARLFQVLRFAELSPGNLRHIFCSAQVPQHIIDRLDTAIRAEITIPLPQPD